MFAALLYVSYESFKLHQTCTMGPSFLSFLLILLIPLPPFLRPLPLSISTFGLKDTEDKPLEKTALSLFHSFFFFLLPSFLFRYRYYTLLRHFSAESVEKGISYHHHQLFPTVSKRAKFIRTKSPLDWTYVPFVKIFNDHPASRYINFFTLLKTLMKRWLQNSPGLVGQIVGQRSRLNKG